MLGPGSAVPPMEGLAPHSRTLAPPLVSRVISLLSVTLLLLPALAGADTATFLTELEPKIITKPGDLKSLIFPGNSTETDYFRLLQRDGNSMLIGARNIVYNISISNLQENFSQRIVWFSRSQDSETCFNKGKSVDECQNYIRVLAKEGEGRFLVCGTNAYKPLCRRYAQQNDGSFNFTVLSGAGMCPYDPRHNSTFVYIDNELYSGTVADFQGTIPLIFRHPLKQEHNEHALKTDPNDYKQLNAPDFVHSFDYGEFVFFFFRETAVEYMNCGKRVYSRVARVCKADKGGSQLRFKSSWTSFLKSRLNCSVPGEYPFYFDEIQSTTDIIPGMYGGQKHELMYAVFTTPPNSIPGSAVCAFSMRAVLDTFEGPYKEQENLNSNWLPVHQNKVPDPRPGSCVEDSQTLPEFNINFANTHPLMDEAVPAFFGRPLLVKASFKYRFTKIAVEPQVVLRDGKTVDVLFVATDSGIIFKAINAQASEGIDKIEPVIIEEIQVFEKPVAIVNMQIAQQTGGESKLIIITDDEVKSIDLHRCYRATTCSSCVGLQDPYCAWFEGDGKCGGLGAQFKPPVFQNISGHHFQCPDSGDNEVYNPSTPVQTTGPVVGASLEGPPIYSAETLAIAVTTACVAALVIGFISGFLFSRKCRGDDYAHTYSETPYLDGKLNKRDNLVPAADPNMYTANNKHINNLVTNYNPKNINGKSNTNTTTDSKLLKPAKCAYI
ncbi:semaphorin-1A-like isoform X5 [Macrobrachium rosenbergii]|uniref:semaphorin-1A-like isoform X5 n=1 Tax=Macrobrachium rosenbergii TaxID=79674 RepID=UPI0034D3DE49